MPSQAQNHDDHMDVKPNGNMALQANLVDIGVLDIHTAFGFPHLSSRNPFSNGDVFMKRLKSRHGNNSVRSRGSWSITKPGRVVSRSGVMTAMRKNGILEYWNTGSG